MSSSLRSWLGASLPRSQQAIILVLGLGLVGLWAWQAGALSPFSPPVDPSRHYYFIAISGDIPRPGVHVFLSPPTVQEVWAAAGGAGVLPNGSQTVTSGGKVSIEPDRTVRLERMSGADLLTLGLALDPNQARAADLETIPGLGPVLARRIVEFRKERGPFKDIENLLEVKGVGPKILEKIRPYVSVSEINLDSEIGRE
jgi:competence protein ComEA